MKRKYALPAIGGLAVSLASLMGGCSGDETAANPILEARLREIDTTFFESTSDGYLSVEEQKETSLRYLDLTEEGLIESLDALPEKHKKRAELLVENGLGLDLGVPELQKYLKGIEVAERVSSIERGLAVLAAFSIVLLPVALISTGARYEEYYKGPSLGEGYEPLRSLGSGRILPPLKLHCPPTRGCVWIHRI